VSDPKLFVPAGLNSPDESVGLTGLVPFEILSQPPVEIAPGPGVVRVSIELPAGWKLDPEASVLRRIFGGDAGLDLPRNGQIVRHSDPKLPIELPWVPRAYPEPPAAGQMALDLSFHYLRADGSRGIQDVQWRQPIVWRDGAARAIELRFTLGT
jgi:hypothetical protein